MVRAARRTVRLREARALYLVAMSGDERQPHAGASDSIEPASNQGSEVVAPKANGAERDDLSFPPVDFDAGFFSRPVRAAHEAIEDWGHDTARRSIESPAAKRRRAQLKKYVSLAMGLASAVCLAALVKGALTSAEVNSNPRGHALAALEHTASPLPEPVVERPAAPAAAPAAELSVAPPAAELPAAPPPAARAAEVPTAAPAAEAPTAAPAAPTAAPAAVLAASNAGTLTTERQTDQREATSDKETLAPDPREALIQKKASQVALEQGRIAASIAAGENAVLLDPLDADAWLILGAAYQQKGNLVEARRCYKACVKRGQRGNRGECSAMLR
jgi:tetratricopeptide (TPR) repeat protein